MARVEFFFDCSSPWTYLAFHRIEDVCDEARAELVWRPILVGGVFNAVNQSVYEQRAKPVRAKAGYYLKDLRDWARFYELEIGQPEVFPVNSVRAMRAAYVALDRGLLPAWARAVFEAYWGDLSDISQLDVLRSLADDVGLDADELLEQIERPEVKQRLRDATDELIERGGFGSPTIFVDETDMYFGNDRLELLRHRLSS